MWRAVASLDWLGWQRRSTRSHRYAVAPANRSRRIEPGSLSRHYRTEGVGRLRDRERAADLRGATTHQRGNEHECLGPGTPELRCELVAQPFLERTNERGPDLSEMVVLNAIRRVAFAQLLEHRNQLVRDVQPVYHEIEHGHELVDLLIQRDGRK